MKEAVVYVGVDVAKRHLDVSWSQGNRRFGNDKAGHRALLDWLGQGQGSVHLVCEASGGYEQPFVHALQRARQPVSLVQANRVRKYAQAAGILAPKLIASMRACSAPLALQCSHWQRRVARGAKGNYANWKGNVASSSNCWSRCVIKASILVAPAHVASMSACKTHCENRSKKSKRS
jgi:Transposase